MHIEFLVEGPSDEAALNNLVPKILGQSASFHIHAYQGKLDLLGKLPSRLRGYRNWLPDSWRIVVLIDEDRENCEKVKSSMEDMAREAGLITKARARKAGSFQVLNRVAVEELEAWFFGDAEALATAYRRVSPAFCRKPRYRNPDAIEGGTWEALERLLQRAGYHLGGLAKVSAAREISTFMEPCRNISRSFQVFRDGLLEMVREAA